MPKLNSTHLSSRILTQIQRLKENEPLNLRNIKAVLTPEQHAAAEAVWIEQKTIHRGKRPRNEEHRKELGIRNKREIYIEALQGALEDAKGNTAQFFDQAQVAAAKRQIEIYTDAVKKALEQGKSIEVARNYANNELTRAGLNRLDRGRVGLNKRDREVNDVEDTLKARIRDDMTKEELEQQKLLDQFHAWKNR